jgi:CheY-like chemotaxis protein
MSKLAVDVLIVDDDDDLCQLFRLLLETEGWTCTVAHNGLTALQAIEVVQPKVMLLDLFMPVLDGFAVLQRLPENRPAVIVVTGAAAVTGVTGLTNGMKHMVRDVLAKPVQADKLIQVVKKALNGRNHKSKPATEVGRR